VRDGMICALGHGRPCFICDGPGGTHMWDRRLTCVAAGSGATVHAEALASLVSTARSCCVHPS
jgi:hypothetical protein